jgi:hypothetical protein
VPALNKTQWFSLQKTKPWWQSTQRTSNQYQRQQSIRQRTERPRRQSIRQGSTDGEASVREEEDTSCGKASAAAAAITL